MRMWQVLSVMYISVIRYGFYVLGVNNLRRELDTPRPSYEAHAVTLKLQTVETKEKMSTHN